MNTSYLDTLPEIRNKYKMDLLPGEKVVFTAKMYGLSTDKDDLLGADDFRMTVTNKRILAGSKNNEPWEVDIAEDVVEMKRMKTGGFWTEQKFILVTLNKELKYGIGINSLGGYKYHLGNKDLDKMEEIIKQMM